MDGMLVVDVMSEVGMRFVLLWALYGVFFRFRKWELLVMAVALIVEAVLLVIIGSFFWAAFYAAFAVFYFWRWKNKKTPETPAP